MTYDPRESINPRAFAVRHALLEELQRRQASAAGEARALFAELARAIEVSYDASAKGFAIRAGESAALQLPLDAFHLYDTRGDASIAGAPVKDPVLAANRAKAAAIVEQLVAPFAAARRAGGGA